MMHLTPVSNFGFVKREFPRGSSVISLNQQFGTSFIHIHIL